MSGMLKVKIEWCVSIPMVFLRRISKDRIREVPRDSQPSKFSNFKPV